MLPRLTLHQPHLVQRQSCNSSEVDDGRVHAARSPMVSKIVISAVSKACSPCAFPISQPVNPNIIRLIRNSDDSGRGSDEEHVRRCLLALADPSIRFPCSRMILCLVNKQPTSSNCRESHYSGENPTSILVSRPS